MGCSGKRLSLVPTVKLTVLLPEMWLFLGEDEQEHESCLVVRTARGDFGNLFLACSVQWLSNAKSIDAGLCNGNIALNCRGSSLSFSLDIIDKNRRIFYLSKGQKCQSNNTFKMVCMNTEEIEEEKKKWSEQIRASKFRRSVGKDGKKKEVLIIWLVIFWWGWWKNKLHCLILLNKNVCLWYEFLISLTKKAAAVLSKQNRQSEKLSISSRWRDTLQPCGLLLCYWNQPRTSEMQLVLQLHAGNPQVFVWDYSEA